MDVSPASASSTTPTTAVKSEPTASAEKVTSTSNSSKVVVDSNTATTITTTITPTKMVNGEAAVRSLATNLESSLSLNNSPPNSSSLATSNSAAVYNGCTGCPTADSITIMDHQQQNHAGTSNSISESETGSLSITHGLSGCSDSSKLQLNAPKFGTPVPNRVFVGGIPVDVSEVQIFY